MKILALDSTAKTSSVAVLEDDRLLCLYSANIKNTHSETLLPMIKSALSSLNLTVEDIDAAIAASTYNPFIYFRF